MAAMNTNTSSKYEDIIAKCDEISLGPPAVYQLRTKTEKIGHVKKSTFGEKNPDTTNKIILLVGETGVGKSTLINALLNYSMEVKWEDNVWFQIVKEEKSMFETQTSDVIVYEIFDFQDRTLPYSLTIIDTPGYGNTGGYEHDEIISHRLSELFRSKDGVHEIDAVGLVMKATDNRLSERLMHVFDSVMSLFGKNLETIIVAFITHSNKRRCENALQAIQVANVKCARNENNQPLHFLFDNCQEEERTEQDQFLKGAHDISQEGMRDFMAFLEKTMPQRVEETLKVVDERARLPATIRNLQEKIQLNELKQKEIKQLQEGLKKNLEEMKANEQFTVDVDEVYKVKEPINGGMWWFLFYEGATCCTACEENCHYPECTMALYPIQCAVMKCGSCTICENKCPALNHVKERTIYVAKTRRVQLTLQDVKNKYEKYKNESENKFNILNVLEEENNKLTAEKSQLLEKTYLSVVNLEEAALKADLLSFHVYLDFLIERLNQKGDREKVQKLMEIRSNLNEETRTALLLKNS